jgi:hypothetical protein
MRGDMSPSYSKRSLAEKLGVKAGQRIVILNPPENYAIALEDLPASVAILDLPAGPFDFIHFFTKNRRELEDRFPGLKRELTPSGMLWVSWPKGSSKVPTDLNENIVRDIGMANGLVDVKVVSVDEVWSALKFVYRVRDRQA